MWGNIGWDYQWVLDLLRGSWKYIVVIVSQLYERNGNQWVVIFNLLKIILCVNFISIKQWGGKIKHLQWLLYQVPSCSKRNCMNPLAYSCITNQLYIQHLDHHYIASIGQESVRGLAGSSDSNPQCSQSLTREESTSKLTWQFLAKLSHCRVAHQLSAWRWWDCKNGTPCSLSACEPWK